MQIGILTSPNQWFEPYAQELAARLGDVPVYSAHESIEGRLDTLFILSYHRLIEIPYLERNQHNLVVHASELPQGKGWAPLFWQVLEGRSEIVFSMIQAQGDVDSGNIVMQRTLSLTGYELNGELRQLQARLTMDMCEAFCHSPTSFLPISQKGEESFYPKRGPSDSELDIDKTLREQFNLLRIVDNETYPAFFDIDGRKYRLSIQRVDPD